MPESSRDLIQRECRVDNRPDAVGVNCGESQVLPLIVTFLDMAKAVGTSPATPVNTPIREI